MRRVLVVVVVGFIIGGAPTNGVYAIDKALNVEAPAQSPGRISREEAWEKIRQGALVVDVRSPEEFSAGHIENALNVPHTAIKENLALFGVDKRREIVLYCGSGRRAGIAQGELLALGFENVYNAGAYDALKVSKISD